MARAQAMAVTLAVQSVALDDQCCWLTVWPAHDNSSNRYMHVSDIGLHC